MPQTYLTHKQKEFKWDTVCEQAFNILKKKLTYTPILQVQDPKGDNQLQVDASNFAVGATLVLKDSVLNMYLPVEYMLHQLSPAECNYSAMERKLVAIVSSLKCWRHYLVGKPCHVRNDHASLKWLMSLPQLQRRQVRWLDFLSQFDLHIEHVPGKQNMIADSFVTPCGFGCYC